MHSHGRDSEGTKEATATPIVTPADDGVAMGPYALYRGAVLHRLVPPRPPDSLPGIRGGWWACGRSSLTGSLAGRPMCRAACDAPGHVPIDAGVERSANGGHGVTSVLGWRLASSVARQWYGHWVGYP